MSKMTMRKYPIEQLTIPKGGLHEIYENYYWLVSEDEHLYFFGSESCPLGSAQANLNKSLAESFAKRSDYFPDFKEVRLIPFVFVRRNVSDYA